MADAMKPFMPTVDLADDALFDVGNGEIVTWAEIKRRASPPAREEAPELALEDAKAFGIGFIVDGQRVSPDRVTVCRGEEAPAEGATCMKLHDRCGDQTGSCDLCDPPLRTRTSEPAREACRLRANHKIVADTMQEMQNEIERLTGARHSLYDGAIGIACQFVRDDLSDYTHPAPATADKLRVAVEALERTRDGLRAMADDGVIENDSWAEIDQAIATLNEEGNA